MGGTKGVQSCMRMTLLNEQQTLDTGLCILFGQPFIAATYCINRPMSVSQVVTKADVFNRERISVKVEHAVCQLTTANSI